MSYSMSPPAQKPAPPVQRPYSPYGNSASPTNQGPYGPPPPKRQRMSPDPRSPPPNGAPYAYPPSQPHGLPPTGYGNPYAPQQPQQAQSPYGTPGGYAQSPQSSFNTPQPYPYQQSPWQSQPPTPAPTFNARQSSPPQHQSREMMPPPPRPSKEEREEKVGVEEIGDSLFGSGINLKDEENYMHTIYANRHTQSDSFTTNQNTSFGSSTMSPNNSFNLLTQGTSFGSQEAQQAFAGTMGQTMSQEDITVEDRRKREVAARNEAERRQHHLNNQFLLCNNVRKRMDKLASNQGVQLNVQGVWVKQPETNVMTNGAGTNGIVATGDRATGVVKEEPKAESLVNMGSPFESVVSLISLAAGERLRGLLDEAYTLARARRYGDHGRVVPPEFSDIAVGEGKQRNGEAVPESVTGTQWDKVPGTDGTNGEDVAMGDASRGKSATPQPQPTVSFQGLLNARLRDVAEKDKQAEKDRLAKREKRKRAAEAALNGDSATTPAESAAPEASTNGGTPAETAAPVKLTKKEQARQKKEQATTTDAQAHSTTNQTAAMMALGKKGSRYAWMSGGAASMPTNRYAKPSASGTATPSAKPDSGPTTPGVPMARDGSGIGVEPKAPEWGDWTEQGKAGAGVQMRDWLLVLERDGRERQAMERAMIALGREEGGK